LFAALSPAQPVSRLIYSAYLNPALSPGNRLDFTGTYAAAADPAGNVVLATSAGIDAVLVKIGPDGSTRFSITIPNAIPTAIATDANANIYVCGAAEVGFQRLAIFLFQTTPAVFLPSNFEPGFVAKLDPDGTLLWASQILASPLAMAVNNSGEIYLTGRADAGSINGMTFQPTPGAVQSTAKGQNAFVAKISSDGQRLLYATYLGGTGPAADTIAVGPSGDVGYAIAVGPSGRVYVAGETGSSDFPVTRNAYQPIYGGGLSLRKSDHFHRRMSRNTSVATPSSPNSI
jgi:Beta-propeller repeat